MGIFEVNSYLEQYVNPSIFLQKGRHKSSGTMVWLYRESAAPTAEWKLFAANEQPMLERNRSMGVTMMPLECADGQFVYERRGVRSYLDGRMISARSILSP